MSNAAASLALEDVGAELAEHGETVEAIRGILARVEPPLTWADDPEIFEDNGDDVRVVRRLVFRRLARALKQAAEVKGKGRTRATRKRKHFRKRTSRKH